MTRIAFLLSALLATAALADEPDVLPKRSALKFGPDIAAVDHDGQVTVICSPPPNGAMPGEDLARRIARLETALRLSLAEDRVNREMRRRGGR